MAPWHAKGVVQPGGSSNSIKLPGDAGSSEVETGQVYEPRVLGAHRRQVRTNSQALVSVSLRLAMWARMACSEASASRANKAS